MDPRAILGFNNRFHSRPTKAATYTDAGGTFNSAQPLDNLGDQQLPIFASFTGPDAELACAAVDDSDAAETFSADLLAVLGHDLPDGALVEFLDGTTLIAAASWRPTFGDPEHLIAVLPDAVSLDTLTVRISNAGDAETVNQIGAIWASPSLRFLLDAKWHKRLGDTGTVSRSTGGTPWTNPGGRGYSMPINFRARNIDLSHGLHLIGSTLTPPATWTTDNATSSGGNEYTFDAVTGTLLEQTGYFTADQHYELEIDVTYDSGQAGIPAVEVGSGNQWALQPGRNQIVGTPDDGSDTALKFLTAAATAFSGTITIRSIRECSAPQKINAKHVIETAATTEPVLWIPRTGQAWHQVAATYGLLEDGGQVTHVSGPVHDVRMAIRQSL